VRARSIGGASVAAAAAWSLATAGMGSAAAIPAPRAVWSRQLPGQGARESSPTLADLNRDGLLDVVVGNLDGKLYAFGGIGGATLPGWPQATGNPIDSSPAAADVDGDGRPEVFVGSGTYGHASGGLFSFTGDGRRRFGRALPDKKFPHPSVFASVAVADFDGNGTSDLSVPTLGLASAWALDNHGKALPGYPYMWKDTMFASPAVADVNGDGVLDMIVAGDSSASADGRSGYAGGFVRAMTRGGRLLWTLKTNDIVRSSPSVGDIDGDGRMEVVFGSGNYYRHSDAVTVRAIDAATGVQQWRRVTDGLTFGSPALADINGDGGLDVAIGTFKSNQGQGNGGSLYALDGVDGSNLPGFPYHHGFPAQPSVVTADLDGDGRQDILTGTGSGLLAVSSYGQPMFRLPGNYQNSPAIADVDGNGRLDIVTAAFNRVTRWELGPQAQLGTLGWPQFRKDARRTGSWAPTVLPPKR
jgi:hypothetical protein